MERDALEACGAVRVDGELLLEREILCSVIFLVGRGVGTDSEGFFGMQKVSDMLQLGIEVYSFRIYRSGGKGLRTTAEVCAFECWLDDFA